MIEYILKILILFIIVLLLLPICTKLVVSSFYDVRQYYCKKFNLDLKKSKLKEKQ